MKKIFYSLFALAISALTLQSCEDVPAPYDIPGSGENTDKPIVEVTEITCAKAIELCNVLEDGASSEETYCITGYITDVFTTISKGQQSFWLSDNNDGQKMVQAYWANLPADVEKFTKGSKVKITGKLLKYVNTSGTVITEVKNADVEILEIGDAPSIEAIEITCAKAIELCNALEDGASSTETYSITGYITDVYPTVSDGQQSFWISDNNDGQKMVQAYWANLPSGVGAFTKGSKVKITGNLLKYVNASQVVIPEVKNADVEILEQGGSSGGSTGDAKHITISEFLSKKDTETTYELSGVVKNIANTTYGNFDLVEGDAKIYIYGLLDKDGNAKNFASLDISEGDEVTLTGVYSEFNGSPQIKNAQFVSVKKGSGGTDIPNPPTGDGMTIESLKAGKISDSDIPTNSYGSQDYNAKSTWYAWKYDNVTYMGARICAANGDFSGCIQVQGNATDVAKQGFIFNETSFSSDIKNIVIVVKGSSKYDTPTEYNVYAGTEAHPTTTSITAQTSTVKGSSLNTFTMTYDLSGGSYKYFTVWNNKVGALYIEKIIITLK